MRQLYHGTKIVQAEPTAKNGLPGYSVTYADGYESWSPKDTFEEAYLPIGELELESERTIRLAGELAELVVRTKKLNVYLEDLTPGSRDPLMVEQLSLHKQLIEVLRLRLAQDLSMAEVVAIMELGQ